MKAITRDPIRFESLGWYADFCQARGLKIADPWAQSEFMKVLQAALGEMLSDDLRLAGVLHESMFESLLSELGETEFVKREDAGGLMSNTAVQPVDFRVTLRDGRTLLIETKDATPAMNGDPGLRIPKMEFRRYIEYAIRAKGELRFAIFWRGAMWWSLVRPEAFRLKGKYFVIDMGTAVKQNEMAILGDRWIGTQTPLRLRILTDPDEPRELDPRGLAEYTVSDVEVYCRDARIDDPQGKSLALFLIFFGRWAEPIPNLELTASTILSVNWIVNPEVEEADPDLYIVGSLSSMHARMFMFAATDAGGRVNRLHPVHVPERLANLAPRDFPFGVSGLRLWIFEQITGAAPLTVTPP